MDLEEMGAPEVATRARTTHAVMVGGVAGRRMREAACPVIVLPRNAGHTENDSLFAEIVAAHG